MYLRLSWCSLSSLWRLMSDEGLMDCSRLNMARLSLAIFSAWRRRLISALDCWEDLGAAELQGLSSAKPFLRADI